MPVGQEPSWPRTPSRSRQGRRHRAAGGRRRRQAPGLARAAHASPPASPRRCCPTTTCKLANPLWSARELRGRVLEVRRETEDSATLVIKPGWGFSFDYEPGQYIGIGRADGRPVALAVVLADVEPGRLGERTITITVKAMPEGFLSTHLVGGRGAGHDRAAGRAAGQFRDARPGAGVGAVPHRGLGHHPGDVDAAHAGRGAIRSPTSCTLHSAPTESDVMFAAELAELAREPPGLPAARCAPRGSQGRLDLARLDDEVPDWRDRQTWACGPEGMLDRRRTGVGGGRHRRAAAPGAVRGVPCGTARQRRHGDIRAQRQDGRPSTPRRR